MANQIIITIGREFGSGGHDIAREIALHYGIMMYDRSILDDVAHEKPDINTDALEELQFDYIKNKAAERESFVVVGRCAETILRDRYNIISIFVTADFDDRIKRVKRKFNIDDESEATNKIKRHDRTRRSYHNSHSESEWSDASTYDITINSSRLGIEGTANFLIDYIDRINNK
ncbi:MAG: cytidylate kinase-like family protein [Lachnospiraceae bacterium]|nr:cytidylate kinase-like family protein [Lachnospiraceae bacterium]